MPDSDPSHTASRDPRKDELSSLFREWDRDEHPRERLGPRLAITLIVALVAGLAMFASASSFAFWCEPATARDLGDMRERYARGDLDIGPGNRHVALRGLVPTRMVAVAESAAAIPSGYIFFCPLARVVVFTDHAIAPDPNARPDPRLAALVQSGLALPDETANSATVSGRLLHGDEAPAALAPFVQSFAQRMQRTPADLWVLIANEAPGDAAWAMFVWALASAALLVSVVFLLRAWRRAANHGARLSFGSSPK